VEAQVIKRKANAYELRVWTWADKDGNSVEIRTIMNLAELSHLRNTIDNTIKRG
jgi:hypothetical protein